MKNQGNIYSEYIRTLNEMIDYCFYMCMCDEKNYSDITVHTMYQAAKTLTSAYNKLIKLFNIKDTREFKTIKTQYEWYKSMYSIQKVMDSNLFKPMN